MEAHDETNSLAAPSHPFLACYDGVVIAQPQPNQKVTTSQKPKGETLELGRSYAELRPEQERLVDEFIRRYNATTGSELVPEQAYDSARLSVRTTYDAVTHALLNAKMTDAQGKSLGRAIDLVDAIDEVMGEEVRCRRRPAVSPVRVPEAQHG